MTSMNFSSLTLQAPGVRSLVWREDVLIDWVGGGATYHLDGRHHEAGVRYAYHFDAALDCAPYSVIFERRGTKGLLLRDGDVVRELNRSFYHASAYEYPVALWRTKSGRTLLAHCPEHYHQLEVEDAETGERLTAGTRDPDDCFHSALALSPSGRRLLSAGWLWHPWSVVRFVEVLAALEDPRALDHLAHCPASPDVDGAEALSAAWQSDDRLLVGLAGFEASPGAEPSTGLAVCDVATQVVLRTVALGYPPGRMMPVGSEYVVTFFQHPRLVSLTEGRVVTEWPELPTGAQSCSILLGQEEGPALALDPGQARFAVQRGSEIVVVQLGWRTRI